LVSTGVGSILTSWIHYFAGNALALKYAVEAIFHNIDHACLRCLTRNAGGT